MSTKQEKRAKLLSKLDSALREVYHNATPTYPVAQNRYEESLFESWFADAGSFEISDMQQEFFKDRANNTLYTYGRGGRTLAPAFLIYEGGGSSFKVHNANTVAESLNNAEVTALIKEIERFNSHVAAWCKSIPEMWKDAKEANDYQADIEAHEGLRPVQTTVWVK